MPEVREEQATPASELIAAAARELGVQVERLSRDVLICSHRGRTVAFHNMAGATSGRFGHSLCRDAVGLARYLASRQIPLALDGEPTASSDIAIVGDQAIAVHGTIPPGAERVVADLAHSAVNALPGLHYATVTIEVHDPDHIGVRSIDPRLRAWARAHESQGPNVASAVVRLELAHRAK